MLSSSHQAQIVQSMAQAHIPAGRIDLGLGQPQLSNLPKAILAESASTLFSKAENAKQATESLAYGRQSGPPGFRQHLADYLERNGVSRPDPESLFITNGASQALEMICSVFGGDTGVVLVENPTYFLAAAIFRDHGLDPWPVPVDLDGICTDALEKILCHLAESGKKANLLYTIPSFQNPSGTTLSLARRKELCRLSLDYGFRIVADEVYQLLHFPDNPPPPPMMQVFESVLQESRLGIHRLEKSAAIESQSAESGVVSVGSFSKILSPGLRLGWIEACPRDITRFTHRGYLTSGGGLNPLVCAITEQALKSKAADEHLGKLRAMYAERCDILCQALIQRLGAIQLGSKSHSEASPPPNDAIWFQRPFGGYFVWVHFPVGTDTKSFGAFAIEAHSVAFKHGALFAPSEDTAAVVVVSDSIRLCFAHYDNVSLQDAVNRIAMAWAGYTRAQDHSPSLH